MTTQIGESLVYDGVKYATEAQPLDTCPRMKRTSFEVRASCCWRGYVGRWSVVDGRLMLLGFRGRAHVVDEAVYRRESEALHDAFTRGDLTEREHHARLRALPETFGVKQSACVPVLFDGQETVFADWFTGRIRGFREDMPMPFGGAPATRCVDLQFQNGVLVAAYVAT